MDNFFDLGVIRFFAEDNYKLSALILLLVASLIVLFFGKGPLLVKASAFIIFLGFAWVMAGSTLLISKGRLTGQWSPVRADYGTIDEMGDGSLRLQNGNGKFATAKLVGSRITEVRGGGWNPDIEGQVSPDHTVIDWTGDDLWVKR